MGATLNGFDMLCGKWVCFLALKQKASGAPLRRAAVQPAHAPKLLDNNSHGSTAGSEMLGE
ncbi:hypothetical protein EYF80_002099 [Liparis tanakae]|uniref:Uncharacterized protein n=1 Tax=Liparis tanakae TaxID=230148 RepID=A0A4Z2JER2_9TELE|nr:hypothetical protein EYF80_002099 [Liparis tanakae]